MLSSLGKPSKTCLESATREQRNGDGHVLSAVERSDPIVRGVGRYADFKGPLEDVFKREIKRDRRATPVRMNVSIGAAPREGCEG